MRILIGEISSYKAIVIARYIRAAYPNAEIWAYDYKPIIRSIHTRYVQQCVRLPFKSLEAYIEALADYVRTQQIDVLLPVHSDHIGAILQRKDLFGQALDWVGDYKDYIRLHEKDQLMAIAQSVGVRVPKTYHSFDEAEVPFVIKPTNLSSAKGVRYCFAEANKQLINSALADINSSNNYIIQEYITGQGCGYEVYCQNGEILVEYGHIRLAEWPTSGGSSVLRGRYIHPDMRPMAEKILSAVPWTGFAMFEFKLTPSGELVLIEVNPRIWGSINQPLQDNCPLFEHILGALIQLVPLSNNNSSINSVSGYKLAPQAPEIRTSLVPQVWLAMLGYLFRGQSSRVRDWLRHWHSTRRDVSFWSDPLGLISMIIRKIV